MGQNRPRVPVGCSTTFRVSLFFNINISINIDIHIDIDIGS